VDTTAGNLPDNQNVETLRHFHNRRGKVALRGEVLILFTLGLFGMTFKYKRCLSYVLYVINSLQ